MTERERYIYIYIEREKGEKRERERETKINAHGARVVKRRDAGGGGEVLLKGFLLDLEISRSA